jgi:arsenate reductase-like glutaredoxin family protein
MIPPARIVARPDSPSRTGAWRSALTGVDVRSSRTHSLEVRAGTRKCAETRKALRFFAERRVKTHIVDLEERAASPGELRRFAQKFGVEALIARGGQRFAELGLRSAQLSEERWLARLAEEPLLLGRRSSGTSTDSPSARTSRRGGVDRQSEPVFLSGVAVEFSATTLFSAGIHRRARRALGRGRAEQDRQDDLFRLLTGEPSPRAGPWPADRGAGSR